MKIAGVILAGGLASRMGGGDKCLLSLGDATLLSEVIARLGPQVDGLALNANGDPARFADYGLPVIVDSFSGYAGPLAGILAGMEWAAGQGFDYIATAAADTPFFPPDLVTHLRAGLTPETPIAMAATPDPERGLARHPTFALWPVALRDDLRAALDDGVRKVVQWAKPKGYQMVTFPVGKIDPFFNVNTPEDLERAQSIFATGAA